MLNEEIQSYIDNGLIKHDIKILPGFFVDVISTKKNFELRNNDRNYREGDIFIMREWDGEYTGKYYINSIRYILKDCQGYGLAENYCIFGW